MIAPEGRSVPALLDAAAEQDREAAVFPDGRASVTDLAALSRSYARALVSLGACPGDHVGALLAAAFPALAAARRGPVVRVPEAACLRSVAVVGGSGPSTAFQSWSAVVTGSGCRC
jgi:hypothetical protein